MRNGERYQYRFGDRYLEIPIVHLSHDIRQIRHGRHKLKLEQTRTNERHSGTKIDGNAGSRARARARKERRRVLFSSEVCSNRGYSRNFTARVMRTFHKLYFQIDPFCVSRAASAIKVKSNYSYSLFILKTMSVSH